MADVTVDNEGSIVLFTPHTDAAYEWIEENLPEDRMTFGQAVVVEWRYADDVAFGMRNDGLEVV